MWLQQTLIVLAWVAPAMLSAVPTSYHKPNPMGLDNRTPLLSQPDPMRHNKVTITTRNGTCVDLVFQATNFPAPPHPIHKHGNKMYLLGQGDGLFTWGSVAEAFNEIPRSFNLIDPPRRDAFATPAA